MLLDVNTLPEPSNFLPPPTPTIQRQSLVITPIKPSDTGPHTKLQFSHQLNPNNHTALTGWVTRPWWHQIASPNTNDVLSWNLEACSPVLTVTVIAPNIVSNHLNPTGTPSEGADLVCYGLIDLLGSGVYGFSHHKHVFGWYEASVCVNPLYHSMWLVILRCSGQNWLIPCFPIDICWFDELFWWIVLAKSQVFGTKEVPFLGEASGRSRHASLSYKNSITPSRQKSTLAIVIGGGKFSKGGRGSHELGGGSHGSHGENHTIVFYWDLLDKPSTHQVSLQDEENTTESHTLTSTTRIVPSPSVFLRKSTIT